MVCELSIQKTTTSNKNTAETIKYTYKLQKISVIFSNTSKKCLIILSAAVSGSSPPEPMGAHQMQNSTLLVSQKLSVSKCQKLFMDPWMVYSPTSG